MVPLSSERAQGADPADCIAKLSSLLEHALREGRAVGEPLSSPLYSCLLSNPPLYVFSTPLLNALLAEHSSFPPSSEQLLSFINQHRDMIVLALETVSLRCLSVNLLKSPANDVLELGLHLLMDEPEYIADFGRVQFQSNVPEPGNLLPLVQQSLAQKTYTIFTNETQDSRFRRMAGKVLAEMAYDCEKHYQLRGILNGNALRILKTVKLRPIIDALADPDLVLSFFASTIFRVLYYPGTNDGCAWERSGPLSKIIKHVQTEVDVIKQFHSYVRTERTNLPRIWDGTRLYSANGALPICYLVESDGAQAKGLPQGPVLLIFSPDGLDLIHCGKSTSGWTTDYMAIRLIHNTQTKCICSSGNGGQKQRIFLHIHADDSVMINDKKRDLQTISLSMGLRDDLTEILKGFKAIGIRCETTTRTSPSSRRLSSLVIPLDTDDDEITPRDSQIPEVPSQIMSNPASHHVHCRNKSANMAEQIDCISCTATERTSRSSVSELSRTPTFCGTSPPRDRGTPHPRSPEPLAKGTHMEERRHAPNIATETARDREVEDCPSNTQDLEKAISKNETNSSEGGPARNTRARSSRNGKRVLTSTLLKPIPPNTQESLIFPRRRPRGKHYTAPTKAMVDWDEDLRASDGSVEQEPHKDTELTSISSPLSRGTSCAFNQGSKMCHPSSARRKPATKPKRQSRTSRKRKGEKGQKGISRQVKLLLPPPENAENYIPNNNPLPDVSRGEPEGNLEGSNLGNRNSSPEDLGAMNNSPQAPKKANNISRQTPKNFLPQKPNTALCRSAMKTSLVDDQHFGGENQGRGQTVAEKLIAAFRTSRTPELCPDETPEKELGDEEYRVEAVHESPEPHNELVHDSLHVKHGLQKEGGITGDDIYPVEIYSVDSPNGSRYSSLQDEEEGRDWILGKREAIFSAEGEQQTKRAQPQSTASTFEFYFTGPPPKESDYAFPDHSEVASVPSEIMTTRDDNGVTGIVGALEKRIKDDRTIVDKNGSPRVTQRARKEHALSKLWGMSPIMEQWSAAKRRELNQEDDEKTTLCTTGKGHAKDDDLQTGGGSTKYTTGKSERTVEGSSKDFKIPGFPKTLKSASPASPKKRKGRHGISKNKEPGLGFQGSTAGSLPLGRADSEQVASELVRATASQIDWQTSLQDLHKGMQRTLLSNSEKLSRRIESERSAVNRVLDIYKEQCHTVLDQLFEAQMERMRICKQQMDSIKQQHADVCQGLIRRLEESERSLDAVRERQ
ncbi:hypothetical protein BDW62DRAFT_218943 [Aspergillus aurantiobrunneus]